MKYFKYVKQLLVVGILLFTTSSTMSDSSIEVRIEPPFGQEEIDYYCVEYRELDESGMPIYPVGGWHCIWITPDLIQESIVGYTTCILIHLNANTDYEIRVHGKSATTGCWGKYGFSCMAKTSSDSNGDVHIAYARCGNFSTEYDDHEDEDGVTYP